MDDLRTLTIQDPTANAPRFRVIDLKPGQVTNPARRSTMRRVEFFDAQYDFTPWGQFIADYCVDTLVGKGLRGLHLSDTSPNWRIDASTWNTIETWLTEGN